MTEIPDKPFVRLRGMLERMMLVQLAREGLDTIECQVEWRTDHSERESTLAEIRLIYPDGAHEIRFRGDHRPHEPAEPDPG